MDIHVFRYLPGDTVQGNGHWKITYSLASSYCDILPSIESTWSSAIILDTTTNVVTNKQIESNKRDLLLFRGDVAYRVIAEILHTMLYVDTCAEYTVGASSHKPRSRTQYVEYNSFDLKARSQVIQVQYFYSTQKKIGPLAEAETRTNRDVCVCYTVLCSRRADITVLPEPG